MNNKKTSAHIKVSIPILKDLPNKGFSLNLGALTISLNERNFILDSSETNYKNEKKKGKKFTFDSVCYVDKETFEEGEEYNYKLIEEDLKHKDLKATFFCSDSDAGIDDAFDFDNATIDCVVNVDDKQYHINVTIE